MTTLGDIVNSSVWISVWHSVSVPVRVSVLNSINDFVYRAVWKSLSNSVRQPVNDALQNSVSGHSVEQKAREVVNAND